MFQIHNDFELLLWKMNFTHEYNYSTVFATKKRIDKLDLSQLCGVNQVL